ncbi:MAG: hypothetical protein JWL63_3411 [Rhodocyclales bacterium]|nr:hypothetical protein [Rhodocyclales bacterium]
MSPSPDWKYSGGVSPERQTKLAAAGSFDELLRLVISDAIVTRVYAKAGSERGLTHCVQPVFLLDLEETGDALFNGPWGYRAQYWLHPSRGLAANRELISALTPKLLAAVDVVAAPDLAKLDLCASLAASSAKLWVRESLTLLTESTTDLAVDRWAQEANRGVELARLGLAAPNQTKFEVKGALLDAHGNEVVPSRKIRRHLDIHNYGFS